MSSDDTLSAILRRSLLGDWGVPIGGCLLPCSVPARSGDDLAATYRLLGGIVLPQATSLVKSHSCARRRSTGFHPRVGSRGASSQCVSQHQQRG